MSFYEGPLGREVPPDFEHVEKYPLTALAAPERPKRAPVLVGALWYPEFDRPEKDSHGVWWVARDGRLSPEPRGGHAFTLLPVGVDDNDSWWRWFNQVNEGICVGEGGCRTQTLNNRVRYQPRWLYDRCKDRDGYAGEGTWVRVALDVMRDQGLVAAKRGEKHVLTAHELDGRTPDPQAGISANRWATSLDDVLEVLGASGRDYVDYTNSWGTAYPRRVRMPASVLDTIRQQDGELAIITDR